ncbi:MAG: hypothetical protein Q8K31_00125 [Burkholderiaceae bacterium]|nr:hypothetical protein [Burkholderiaceae bacterium]MDO9089584.1 hypothetical protein [Burkholderiaceae bacterium]MDP1967583.1 hypothetical protein [Burkholderiaceae bacterium]
MLTAQHTQALTHPALQPNLPEVSAPHFNPEIAIEELRVRHLCFPFEAPEIHALRTQLKQPVTPDLQDFHGLEKKETTRVPYSPSTGNTGSSEPSGSFPCGSA